MSTSQKIIRVGLIGCGEVAQTTHLPTFQLLAHQYKVTALADVSQNSLDHCATKFGIAKTFTNSSDLIKDPEASIAVDAADAGKHVFIEKPMALTHKDAQSIIDAQERNKVVIFVGYMRRYAGAFQVMKEEVKKLKSISFVSVRDIIGMNSFFVDQSGTFPKAFTDFPADANADRQARGKAIAETAIGSRASDPRDVMTYRLLGGLGSHDLSAMRELIGLPKKCIAASRVQPPGPPLFITAMFEYEGYTAVYETGIDQVGSFDAHIEVIGDGKRLKLQYDTPYVKGLPVTLTIKETDENGYFVERLIRPTYTDAYTLEYESLYKSITEGAPVKTTPKDAAEDLKIFDMLFESMYN
ncbi:hypothetical protein JCM8547_006879 [Rhodosporidiobolus lusitaniae]